MKIATIINYCTNDYRFIKNCIDAVLPFSSQVLVPVADHFFDNTPEDLNLIKLSCEENEGAEFLGYEYTHDEKTPPIKWHNTSRSIGAANLADDIDWVLFLDSDEIVNTELFTKWLADTTTLKFNIFDSFKLANYWYWREPIYRAKEIEDSAVLIRRSSINIDVNNRYLEREQFQFQNTPRNVMHDDQPMIHHYSWVRTKEQMLRKVKSWSHTHERDWASLVEEEFSRDFNGTCFVKTYEFEKVEAYFNKVSKPRIFSGTDMHTSYPCDSNNSDATSLFKTEYTVLGHNNKPKYICYNEFNQRVCFFTRSMNDFLYDKMRSLYKSDFDFVRMDHSWEIPVGAAHLDTFLRRGQKVSNGLSCGSSLYLYSICECPNFDWVINIDEDFFVFDEEKIISLLKHMIKNEIDYCGVSDGGQVRHRTGSPLVVNPFFNIFNTKKIRNLFSIEQEDFNKCKKESEENTVQFATIPDVNSFKNKISCEYFYKDYMFKYMPKNLKEGYSWTNSENCETYYQFFNWLLCKGLKPLYLECYEFKDEVSSIVKNHNNEEIGIHTWASRFYGQSRYHTKRIDEAYEYALSLNSKVIQESKK